MGGKRAFLCLHGAQNGHCYSSAELREIADKVDELQEGESKKTALVFIQVDGPVGAALIVHNRKGALGTINIDGRWPGRWKSWQNSNRRSVSPEEMMEIAVKCAELARK
ncbi:TPA: hypothetical protein DEB29_02290 [Candidatus Wolfebacteria bacterium]|nr:hypothetical protein [Candidatus Wolfebacteria bacterium]